MSSSISTLVWANSMLSLKSKDKSLSIDTISKISFYKNDDSSRNLHGISCRSLQYCLINRPLDHRRKFVTRRNANPPPNVPNPSGPPSGSLRNWIVGIVLIFVLPFFTHRWGSFLLLKNKIDTKIDITEHVVKSTENVAEKVDKVIDSITDRLPNDSKLKKTLEFMDEVAEGVAKTAHVTDDIINKVEAAEGKLESLIHHKNRKGEKSKEGEEITAQESKIKKLINKIKIIYRKSFN